MSKLRDKWMALREELARVEREIAQEEAPARTRVRTAADLYHALVGVPPDAELSFDDGDFGPALEASCYDAEGAPRQWLFLLPDAPD